MTTQDFIKTYYNVDKYKFCASVMVDGGKIYSYGKHYLLAVRIGTLDFVNKRPYSSTTQRHQSWARTALRERGLDPINVYLSRDEADTIESLLWNGTTQATIDAYSVVLKSLASEYKELSKKLDAKKRKDTQVYADLDAQRVRIGLDMDDVANQQHELRALL